MANVSIVILTFNEAIHIERAIESVRLIAKTIFVVDSYSTDDTVELATSCGAVVFRNKFVNQAQQLQWFLDNVEVQTEWIMRLDADEVVEPELTQEILHKLPRLDACVNGVLLKRKYYFMGKWIRFGGRFPLVMLRIWRKGHGRIESRWMDEHLYVEHGKLVKFSHCFCDNNLRDLTYFVEKHNKYATREAIEILFQKYKLFGLVKGQESQIMSLQAIIKHKIKDNLYNKMPFFASSSLYFIFRYLFQLGFLDGRRGLVYHFLQGWWYRFLVGSKVLEYGMKLEKLTGRDERVEELSRLTGLDVRAGRD